MCISWLRRTKLETCKSEVKQARSHHMHIQPFDMSNPKDGFGQAKNEDTDDPYSRSCGVVRGDSRHQHPNPERLGFPLGTDESALEYEYSLKALNVAFGCYPESLVGNTAPPGTSPEVSGQSDNSIDSSMMVFSPSAQIAGTNPGWQQQPLPPQVPDGPATNIDPVAGLATTLGGSIEAHDSQGRVQGMFGSKKAKTPLPIDFKPSSNSVILGRGRCSESIGNRRFKVVVRNHLQEYLNAPGKLEKTFVSTA